jgi:hypothetical protein
MTGIGQFLGSGAAKSPAKSAKKGSKKKHQGASPN